MIDKVAPTIVKQKTVRFPTWSEVGYILQGCGIGTVIGRIFSDTHLSVVASSIIFVGLLSIGGHMITSSKR